VPRGAEVNDPARPWQIRSSVVASQVEIHREWGGVVPELASRQHIRDICGVVERALGDAEVMLANLDAIAVTQGPGLVGSLLVGLSFAKSLAVSASLPLVPVHHLAGHIESLFLHNGSLPQPAAVHVVSGGHTSLFGVPGRASVASLAHEDDAAGRRMQGRDCWARIPAGDRRRIASGATTARSIFSRADDPPRQERARRQGGSFSFSSIKTAVLRQVKSGGQGSVAGVRSGPGRGQGRGRGGARSGRFRRRQRDVLDPLHRRHVREFQRAVSGL
jgi:N6-L-threonylcarbamoyladenine synthase